MNCYLKKPWEGLQVLTAVCWYQFYNLCLERGRGNEQRLRFGTSFELDCVNRRTFCGQNSPGELFITVECKEITITHFFHLSLTDHQKNLTMSQSKRES